VVTNHSSKPTFRRARPNEGPALNELALRAKAHWARDAAFLEGARDDLSITEATVPESTIAELEQAGVVIGFYGLVGKPPGGPLEWLFLEPTRSDGLELESQ
jgi:hypothetical protein